jgi:2-isopropylmalate synthase
VNAIRNHARIDLEIVDYREHAIGTGSNATAVAYVEVKGTGDESLFGVGLDRNIVQASLKAVTSAINRLMMLDCATR